ncbi:MAG: hydroxymethylglutaryl-CoA lyase [Leptospiraceae bacterium]|nr:hydroxymethylglutaryl-CoA lyase [Leptospiraceae bacterium]
MKKEKVEIIEVGPRDGLQNEKQSIDTEIKYSFIKKLLTSGLSKIEITSFVRPDRIPQLADSKELCKKLESEDFRKFQCLVPNLKGLNSAMESGMKEISVFTAASDEFTKKNINQTIDESMQTIQEIISIANQNGIRVRGYVSTVIACPYSGSISPEKVLDVVRKLIGLGCYQISLGDTIGVGTPIEIKRLIQTLTREFPIEIFSGHYHNTYGMGVANVYASLELGMRSFDSSSGGLGGCPYATGASGNLATEELVYYLEKEGFETGVDLDKLISASETIEKYLGKKLPSNVYQAMISKNR